MKKASTTIMSAIFFASSLVLASCSGNSDNATLKGTTTGGLDIGPASGRRDLDSATTDADTLRTTTGTTTTGTTGGATTN